MTSAGHLYAQKTLPGISVRNSKGKIIVSWKNEYTVPVTGISIQRSYDSIKNYTTIGSVLNPQNKENGYADSEPPYNKMYYRVSISFAGGTYIVSGATTPVKDTSQDVSGIPNSWQLNPMNDPNLQMPPSVQGINYPSSRIFKARDNNVMIHLPGAAEKKYKVKFFNEQEKMIFELTKIKDDILIIEKVNFGQAGWYRFEIYENGLLIEKNKLLVPKDGKINSGDYIKKPENK